MALLDTLHTPRVFSGVQPTGNMHLGNYLGAVKRFVELQKTGQETLYCIVDMHAITVHQSPDVLRQSIYELTATYIACGLDPEKSVIFNQSQVPAHAQLAWIFNCVARLGWVNRMTQFKDKAGKNREAASVGLYTYPVLQAADILAYKATEVPIGEDQKQHLELCRDIAEKFNRDFDAPDFFPKPEPRIQKETARIMSLRDGTKKMSKSDPSDMSRINLNDDRDTIKKKIRKAKTDTQTLPDNTNGLSERPEARNLVEIYAALVNQTTQKVLDAHAGKDFAAFKPVLTEILIETLDPIAMELKRIQHDIPYINNVLSKGATRARAISEPVIKNVHNIVGLLNTP